MLFFRQNLYPSESYSLQLAYCISLLVRGEHAFLCRNADRPGKRGQALVIPDIQITQTKQNTSLARYHLSLFYPAST